MALRQNSQKAKKLILFLLGLLLVSFFMGITGKKFTLWTQVKDYYRITTLTSDLIRNPGIQEIESMTPADQDRSSQKFFDYKNMWDSIPTILVYPVIKIHSWTLLEPHLIFSYFCYILIVFFTLLSAQIQCLLEKKEDNFSYYFFSSLALFTTLSLFMNGRLIYSFLGGACLLYAQTSWITNNKLFPLIVGSFVGILLSSVSSGTFLVIFGSCLLFSAIFPRTHKCLLVLLFIFFPLLTIYLLLKNIYYFNGSIWGILIHGYGKIITDVYKYNNDPTYKYDNNPTAFIYFIYKAKAFLYTREKYLQLSPFLTHSYVTIFFWVFSEWSIIIISMGLIPLLILAPYGTRKLLSSLQIKKSVK